MGDAASTTAGSRAGPVGWRNWSLRPGDEFCDGVALAGWNLASRWGWDPTTQGFYAQLWRNSEALPGRMERMERAPEVWLQPLVRSGFLERYPWPGCVVLGLVAELQARGEAVTAAGVVDALGLAAPSPVLRPRPVLARALLDAIAGGAYRRSTRALQAGSRDVLEWVVCDDPPAREVVAEMHMTTGRIYLAAMNPLLSPVKEREQGRDTTLWWALGLIEDLPPAAEMPPRPTGPAGELAPGTGLPDPEVRTPPRLPGGLIPAPPAELRFDPPSSHTGTGGHSGRGGRGGPGRGERRRRPRRDVKRKRR